MRLISLRRNSIAGGTTTRPISDNSGSCATITLTRAISVSRSRPIALIRRLSTSVMDLAPVVSRARNSDECRSEKKPMLSLISLANSRRWLLARMALLILRQDHGVAVGRDALDEQQQHGDAGENGDAGNVLVDIGLVDHLAQHVGRARGRGGRDPHQRKSQQIAPPIGDALFHHQAANQDRRAIGVVRDFLVFWKFGHPRSIDDAGSYTRVSGLLR